MAAYETTLQMTQFAGVYQDGDGINMNLKYAADAVNCDTTGGLLKPMRAGKKLPGSLESPIGTLMHLYRRFWPIDTERDVLVAACGTHLYYRLMTSTTWTEVQGFEFTSDQFDFVTYEKTREGEITPADILLFTNADDGMFCFWGDDFTVTPVNTQGHKFGVLARHAERIWGSGITDEPDLLYYSAPYDPFNWEQNNEIPEDGAGNISQPSWDGDSFVALRNYGSYLLAIKKERIWRVMGTDPTDYYLREQYGGGAIVENTVVVNASYALMLGYDGIMQYDGSDVSQFAGRNIQAILSRVNPGARAKACAIIADHKYRLALPLDGSEENNAILEYDLQDRTFNLRYGVPVKAFLKVRDKVYYTSAKEPSFVYEMNGGDVLPLKWVSGFQDLGAKNVTKSGFTVYLAPEAEADTAIDISIETEKKRKTKSYFIKPGGKTKRLMFGVQGRRFRVIIEAHDNVFWSMPGGLQISCELDGD